MKIHCITIVCNEADVIEFTLMDALKWADNIFVCDNGSTDGTWELLQELESQNSSITVLPQHEGPAQSLRAHAANQVRHIASPGDWWCRLDADEIYPSSPREFLSTTQDRYEVVWGISCQYYFTDKDLKSWEKHSRKNKPWSPSQSKYYITNASERRFVRHFPGLHWEGSWPKGTNKMRSSPNRIIWKHYQYRSPEQIKKRIATRSGDTLEFRHENKNAWCPQGLTHNDLFYSPDEDVEEWRHRIVKAEALRNEEEEGLVVNNDKVPPIAKDEPYYRRLAWQFRRKTGLWGADLPWR